MSTLVFNAVIKKVIVNVYVTVSLFYEIITTSLMVTTMHRHF